MAGNRDEGEPGASQWRAPKRTARGERSLRDKAPRRDSLVEPTTPRDADRDVWDRLVESAVGAHLANAAASGGCELFYWRDRNCEVDFVLRAGRRVVAVEVESGARREAFPGLAAFAKAFRPTRSLLVGTGGIPAEDFLRQPASHWLAP